MLPGGLYIIEDIAFHYGHSADDAKGCSDISIPDYLLRIASNCLARRQEQDWGSARYSYDNIDSISFIRSAAIFKKKDDFDVAAAVSSGKEYLQVTGETAEKQARLAAFILRHGGPLVEAEFAAERALELGGNQPGAFVSLAEIRDRQGRLDDAANTLRTACELHPNNGGIWRRRGHLENRRRRFSEAAAAFECAVALRPKDPGIHHELSNAYEEDGQLDKALTSARQCLALSTGDATHERFIQNVARLEALHQAIGRPA